MLNTMCVVKHGDKKGRDMGSEGEREREREWREGEGEGEKERERYM